MGKGLPRSHNRGQFVANASHIGDAIGIESVPIVIDGATGVGFGSAPVGGFPVGQILMQGARANISVVGAGSQAGLVDTWSGDYSVGSTPADDGTLTAGDIDIIGSTAIGPAVAEVAPAVEATNITTVLLDNSAGDLEVNVNVLVDDANISADGVLADLVGDITISYQVL